MVYWIVSVPYQQSKQDEQNKIKSSLSNISNCKTFEFEVPQLKIGTVDQLLSLSDDLHKYDSTCEQVTMKVLRTIGEMNESNDNDFLPEVIIQDPEQTIAAEHYLRYFKWNDSQYLPSKAPRDTSDSIYKKITKYDEELKVKMAEYQNLKQSVQQMEKKSTGSLSVRTLDGLVKSEHYVDSEYLTTLFVVVPKSLQKEWEGLYENLTDYVVPDSSQLIHEDNEYCLNNVVLLKKIADDFRKECTKHKFIVRDFEFDQEKYDLGQMEKQNMEEKLTDTKMDVFQWCRMAFSECFSSWIHLKAIRVFVESVLRYGLPPNFAAVLIKADKNEKKIHKFFRDHYKHLEDEQSAFSSGLSENDMASSGAAAALVSSTYGMEWQPYVLITVNTDYPLLNVD